MLMAGNIVYCLLQGIFNNANKCINFVDSVYSSSTTLLLLCSEVFIYHK